MGRLGDAMAAMVREGRKAFVPFIESGDPSLDATRLLWRALDRAGADVIEIGVPFSDPLADGPTIQRASERALRSGTTLAGVLDAVAAERAALKARLVIFTYLNPVMAMGLERFADRAADSGADAVLVPDLIAEEAAPLRDELDRRGLDLVLLVAPTTPDDRLDLIGRGSPAMVYAVSLTGVTGARDGVPEGVADFVARCRRRVRSPLVVGFGISTPAAAREVAALADGAVVGSALVALVEKLAGEGADEGSLVAGVYAQARELAEAVHGA